MPSFARLNSLEISPPACPVRNAVITISCIFIFNDLKISSNELKISANDLKISSNELKVHFVSSNDLKISSNDKDIFKWYYKNRQKKTCWQKNCYAT